MTSEPSGSEGDVPQQLSYYRVGPVLGSGGMGTVHEATDTRNGITVALKLLHPHLAADESYRERFQREAHVAALLRSPYTVQLLDYGFEQGRYFLVMKLVDGETVREVLRRGPLQPEHALRIAAQVARALEEAEARGVVHRDIKPENIMLAADGAAQVLDFGIARQVGAATLTATGAFIGTLTYASPESFAGEADHRSDIYSLGATLYHALSGRPPFEGDALELLRQQRETPMPREALAGLRPEVVEALARCLEKDPSDRYQSAAELAGVLEHLAQRAAEGREPALAAPSTEVITAGGRRTATTEALTLELGPPAVQRRYVPRRRRASYELVLRNDRGDPVELRLDASDAEGRCAFSLPERASVAAHDAITVKLEVAPRERRWRGDRETRRFSVSASGGGGPTLTVSGDFDDRPEGWLPYAGGTVFAAALVGVAVTLVGMLGPVAAPEGGDETAAPGVVAAPSVGGRIAFVSDRDDDGNIELYTMNADGSGLARLAELSGAFDDPAWSPDGTRVAFAWNPDGNSDIYVMNADGSGVTRLTRDPAREITPAWSPDGGRIAFASYRSGNPHIYVMNADGTDITRLADGVGSDPAWSPDGTTIAFTGMTDDAGAISVYTMNADGTGVTRLTYTSAIDPGWSPDAGTAESGAPKRWLPADPAIDVEHAWSPDGARIAFSSNRDGNFGIYVMSADGSGPVRLTDDAGEDFAPAWSPDGTKIAFTSNRDGSTNIYVMNADGSGLTRLTADSAGDLAPGWWTGATRVVVPSTIARAIEVDGGADFFTFDVRSGTSYAISVDPQTLRDVRLLLTFPAELQPRSTAIGRGENGSELLWAAPFSGAVTVSVDSHSGATGSYMLSVTDTP